MFKLLLPFQKAAILQKTVIYLAVLLLICSPLSFLNTPIKTYAANGKANAVQKPQLSAAQPLRIHTAPPNGEGSRGAATAETEDALSLPLIQDAKRTAQTTLMEKREQLDREWLALKQSQQKQEALAAAEQKTEQKTGQTAASAKNARASSGASSSETLRSLGTFKLTAYCPCYHCSSGWGRMTSSGKTARPHHTIAVDPNVIAEGTRIRINGETYVAEDVGGGVKGKHIDIFYENHSDALNFGVRYAEVFVVD